MAVKTDFRDYSFAGINNLIIYISNPNAAADVDLEPTDKLSETDMKTMAVFKQSIDELKESIDSYDPSWWQMIIDLFTLQWCALCRLRAIVPQVQAAVDLRFKQQEALEIADAIIDDASIETQPYKPRGEELDFQPNPRIAKLITVYNKIEQKLFKLLETNHKDDNPWKDQEIIDITIYGLKLAYQINKESILNDLPGIKAKIKKESPEKIGPDYTPLALIPLRASQPALLENFMLEYEAYTSYDSYLERSFYFTIDMYYYMRGQIFWGKNPHRVENSPNSFLYDSEKVKNDTEYAAPFYEVGTWQNSMRLLFNDYCALVKDHVSMEVGPDQFDRHLPWIMPDIESRSFDPAPAGRST